MSQCDQVLEALRRGETVTPLSSYERFRTLALHSRISELRQRGHKIECRVIRDGAIRYGSYRLVTEMVP